MLFKNDEASLKLDIVNYEFPADGGEPDTDDRNWLVLDYAHVLVHVFTKDTREFYNLEKLYAD